MPGKVERPAHPLAIVVGVFAMVILVASLVDVAAQRMLESSTASGGLAPRWNEVATWGNRYLAVREVIFPWRYAAMAVAAVATLFAIGGLRRLSAWTNRLQERQAGMSLDELDYSLTNPFGTDTSALFEAFRVELVRHDDEPRDRPGFLLGFDAEREPVYLSESARSLHVQVPGKIGSGKTKSVLEPLLFQDARFHWKDPRDGRFRRRCIVWLDGKGSEDVLEDFGAIAQAVGRRSDCWLFTMNNRAPGHSYNPVFMDDGDDPVQVAERVFATFADSMQEMYYRNLSYELWVALVRAAASTERQMTMADLACAISNRTVMVEHLLPYAKDREAAETIRARYDAMPRDEDLLRNYSGLLASVRKFDHPRLNTYDPDIVLSRAAEQGEMVAFALPSNAFPFQARAVGLCILQHLQSIGAARQMDRRRSQAPICVYADEFYDFAYEGFSNLLNKLRDANLHMVLAHQDMSDLRRVSDDFAASVEGNTRNKIYLFQSDPDVCERIAQSVGTVQGEERTVRRSVDGWLNATNELEASARMVDRYRLHPSRLKSLRIGQAYLIQDGVEQAQPPKKRWGRRARPAEVGQRVVGVNLPLWQRLPSAEPRPAKPLDTTNGLALYSRFGAGVLP